MGYRTSWTSRSWGLKPKYAGKPPALKEEHLKPKAKPVQPKSAEAVEPTTQVDKKKRGRPRSTGGKPEVNKKGPSNKKKGPQQKDNTQV